jgi:hypothetical protein
MHQRDTTVKGRGDEAAQVVNHSAAKRDDARVLGDAMFQNLIAGRCKDIQCLVTLGTWVSTFVNGVGGNDDLVGLNTSIVEAFQAFLTVNFVNYNSKGVKQLCEKPGIYKRYGQMEGENSIHTNCVRDQVALGGVGLFGDIITSTSCEIADGPLFDNNVRIKRLSGAVEAIVVDFVVVDNLYSALHGLGLSQGQINGIVGKVVVRNANVAVALVESVQGIHLLLCQEVILYIKVGEDSFGS